MLLAAASIAAINPYFLRGYGETGSRNCNTTSDCHKVPWQCKRHAVRICWNVAFTGPIPQRQRSSELFAFWNLNILFLGYELDPMRVSLSMATKRHQKLFGKLPFLFEIYLGKFPRISYVKFEYLMWCRPLFRSNAPHQRSPLNNSLKPVDVIPNNDNH